MGNSEVLDVEGDVLFRQSVGVGCDIDARAVVGGQVEVDESLVLLFQQHVVVGVDLELAETEDRFFGIEAEITGSVGGESVDTEVKSEKFSR